MTTPAVTTASTPYRVAPYLTVAEFQEAPTGVDLSNLVVGGGQAQEDARLAEAIARASSWVDTMCGQVLGATTDTESGRLRPNRNGELVVHPKYWPVLQVNDFRFGGLPSSLSSMQDLSNVFVQPHGFTVTMPALGLSGSLGAFQFGSVLTAGRLVFAQWTYVNGYANTTLAVPCNANDQAITVADATGIIANLTYLTIFDGSSVAAGVPAETERGLLVTAVAGNVLTLAQPVAFAHAGGVSVSALPDAVKEATILLTKTLIETRGTEALVSDDIGGPSKVASMGGISEEDVAIAAELLAPYGRVR